MKNVTISVEDEIYRKARVFAAEQGASLSSLVRGYLQKITSEEEKQREEALERNKMMDQLLEKTGHFRIGPKPQREELHRRVKNNRKSV